MRIQNYLSILTLILVIGCNKPQSANQKDYAGDSQAVPIDTVLLKKMCLTVDGDSAEIKYHILVSSWDQPVLWSMDITSKGKRVFFYSSLDTSIDEFFRDTTYLFNCSNYIDCKKKWYLDRITKCNIDTVTVDDERRVNLARESNVYFDEFFKKYSMKKIDSKSIYNNFWLAYSKKDIISFVFCFAPEARYTPSLAYYPKEEMFIPIYSP